MKPFDLEAALAGAPVVTRTGNPVTQLVIFDITDPNRLFGVLGGRSVNCWKVNGSYFDETESSLDLFMAPEKRTLWINLYASASLAAGAVPGGAYVSEADADESAMMKSGSSPRIGNKAWPIEVEM